jgi:hypothetical protein
MQFSLFHIFFLLLIPSRARFRSRVLGPSSEHPQSRTSVESVWWMCMWDCGLQVLFVQFSYAQTVTVFQPGRHGMSGLFSGRVRDRAGGRNRMFFCGVCGYATAKMNHATRHYRQHDGEKPFACSHCERTFTRKANMMMHVAKVHSASK